MSKEPQVRKDHNGGLTGETLAKHVRAMAAAEKVIEDGKAKLKAAKAAAKDDGVPMKELLRALDDSKLDPQAYVDRENRYISMVKLLRLPINTQLSFLDDVDGTAALTPDQLLKRQRNDGYQAGLAGKNRDTCPHDPNTDAGRQWMEGYEEGQGKNLSKITDGKGNAAVAPKAGRGRGKRGVAANDPTPPAGEQNDADGSASGEASENSDEPPIPPMTGAAGESVETRH